MGVCRIFEQCFAAVFSVRIGPCHGHVQVLVVHLQSGEGSKYTDIDTASKTCENTGLVIAQTSEYNGDFEILLGEEGVRSAGHGEFGIAMVISATGNDGIRGTTMLGWWCTASRAVAHELLDV